MQHQSSMALRTFVYVDGENHFIRGVEAAASVFQDTKDARDSKALDALGCIEISGDHCAFPGNGIDGRRFVCNRKLQFFWDSNTLRTQSYSGRAYDVKRAVYCCSFVGDDTAYHAARVKIRQFGFEPLVIREVKAEQKRRDNKLIKQGILDKAKGCDIAIATRMVADAASDLFDYCCLFTSDRDFLPAVEAVRRMGKVVKVFGYGSAIGNDSPYLFVPDEFIDLEKDFEMIKRDYLSEFEKALAQVNGQ